MARTNSESVVYVVDDDDSVRKGLTRLLRSAGFESRAFGSVEKFLDEVRDEPSTCVLLDITMPHLSGLQVQARLKSKGIHMPVIAVSARDDAETARAARELGVHAFFRKPVDDQALIDAIRWAIGSDKEGRST